MKITKTVIKGMVNYAKQDAPLEACGYLAGKDSIITKIYALANTDKSNEHFSFEPKEQFRVVKDVRAQ
ncbi:MAG: Mov34/MPN/PAD-1 family protein, partial [Candidatus Omnitrophota bacterium]|nr:Mov34/MPN/PAD-1 family protein [Candidatus Omnitrophota bacterium]